MNDDSTASLKDFLFVLVLMIVFITLKVTAVIAWPWLWVLSPAWISGILYFIKAMGIDLTGRLSAVADILREKFFS